MAQDGKELGLEIVWDEYFSSKLRCHDPTFIEKKVKEFSCVNALANINAKIIGLFGNHYFSN